MQNKKNLPYLSLAGFTTTNKQIPRPGKKKKRSKKSSGTKHFGNPNGTKGAFVIGPQSPGSIQGDTVVERRGKHHIIGRCRIFHLAFKGHHSQNVAIGLTGLTLGNSFSKYTNLWLGISEWWGFLSAAAWMSISWRGMLQRSQFGAVLYAWHFYPLVRKTMREGQSPSITIVPFSSKTKLRGVGKAFRHKMINRRTAQPTLLKGKIRRVPQQWTVPGYRDSEALRGKVNPTQRHHFSVQH